MKNITKTFLIALIVIILLAIIGGAYKAFAGSYFQNASFITSGLLVLALVAIVFFALKGIRSIWRHSAVILIISLQACSYAKSNQQVVVSTDCGMSWNKINAGDAVPKGTMNACYMKVVMPNYPMQGDSKFITNLKDRVRASVHIDYDYSITDPLAFIKQAKYLGKANTNADSDGALSQTAFEGAENMVIDKRIKDVSKALFLNEDIVELDQAEVETSLLAASNKILEPLGVRLNFITLTFDLDEQTRQAIDISTAMKIYESKNLAEIGKQVMAARAGATKITVENKTTAPPVAE